MRTDRDVSDAPADLVFRGGTVLTLDAAGTRGTAVAVRHGRIVLVGGDDEVLALIGRRTRVVELEGRAVIPGINDSHLHATWLGAMWPNTVFGAADAQAGAPAFEGDPHDAAPAAPLVGSAAEIRAAILRAGELAASLGITSYTEPGLGPGEDAGATGCFSQAVLDEYIVLEAERALTARVNVLMLFGVLDGPSELHSFSSRLRATVRETERPAWLRIAGVKIFADGIPPMLQAWTRRSYPDGSSGGLLVTGLDAAEREANLRQMIRTAHRAGFQVGVHATGDRTIEVTADAVAEAMAEEPTELRHYVIHGDLVTGETLAVMARLGMGLNVQAGIAVQTSAWVAGVLGEEVAAAAWPLADTLAAGVSLSLSSDAPILSPDWREGAAAADAWMGPAAPGAEEERMLALLHAYTVAPARQDGADAWKGTLEPKKVADLIVLSADPLTLTPADLPGVSIDMTVVDGDVVFERAVALIG
ncbi:metal-dependent hydrolase [Microterricola viridarii]|uniref:Metal-dependent hydrolase n=1 Tax=Microterricola viridarii TaxID=412690 RepID=A0A0Y0NGE9_9MICO|nr:metal-dependent hydrolase [Microterricola viridarii]